MGQDEALAALAAVKEVLGERGKNVHVVSAALQALQHAGEVAGDRAPTTSSWRVVFPALLALLRDSGKVVAAAAMAAADTVRLPLFFFLSYFLSLLRPLFFFPLTLFLSFFLS